MVRWVSARPRAGARMHPFSTWVGHTALRGSRWTRRPRSRRRRDERGTMLEKLGRFMARHHWPVIGVWVVLLVGVGAYAAGHTGTAVDEFAIPGAQSQQALDLLEQDFPAAAGTSATVVYEAPSGQSLTDAANAAAIGDTVAELQKLPNVSTVSNPLDQQPVGITFDEGNPQLQQAYSLMNEAKTVGYSTVSYSTS